MSVRVGAGQGLVAPVDGVGPAVQAVVVRGWGAGGGHWLQAVAVRLGQRLQPGEQHLGATIRRHLGHLGQLTRVQSLSAAGVILKQNTK